MEIFNWYNDTEFLDFTLFIMNIMDYFIVVGVFSFFILFSLGSDQYSKRKVLNFSFYKVFFLTMFFLFLNYFFNLYLNNITLFIITLSTVFLLFFNINKKSLKYISISLLVFLYCINLIYQYSLYTLIHMGDFLLIDLNLNTLEYNFKHFFSIYNKNENIVSLFHN